MRLVDVIKQAKEAGQPLTADVIGYVLVNDHSMTLHPSEADDHIAVQIEDASFRERLDANIPMVVGSLYTHACDCRLTAEFSASDGVVSIRRVESGMCSFPGDGNYGLNDGQYWPHSPSP